MSDEDISLPDTLHWLVDELAKTAAAIDRHRAALDRNTEALEQTATSQTLN